MIFHNVEQNTEEWDELRLRKATASNFGKFMANDGKAFGEPAKRYALQIALERVTGRKSEFSFKNDDMERGHAQEPIARQLYEELNFINIDNGGFFCWGDYGDSPDGLVNGSGVIEIKSVIAPTHYETLKRGTFDPAYKWQLIGHLDCTQRDWVDFASYCSDFPDNQQLIVYRIEKDSVQNEINSLRQRRADFLGLVSDITAQLLESAA